MARASIPTAAPSRDGVALASEQTGDSSNGHVITNTGRTLIIIRNADTSDHTATFVIPGTVDGQAIADRTVTVPASSSRVYGKFSTSVYGRTLAVNVSSSQLKLSALEP